jgi:hypothetical protein
LENHPDFIELKDKLAAYFEDRNLPLHRQRLMVNKSRNWREVLFNSLLELLSELTFTEDHSLQMKLLAKVKKWYEEKTTAQATLSSPAQTRLSRPVTAQTKGNLTSRSGEEVKCESISRLVHQSSAKLPTLDVQTPDKKLFYDRAKPEYTEEDYARPNKRFNELREREMHELRAIATRGGKH